MTALGSWTVRVCGAAALGSLPHIVNQYDYWLPFNACKMTSAQTSTLNVPQTPKYFTAYTTSKWGGVRRARSYRKELESESRREQKSKGICPW